MSLIDEGWEYVYIFSCELCSDEGKKCLRLKAKLKLEEKKRKELKRVEKSEKEQKNNKKKEEKKESRKKRKKLKLSLIVCLLSVPWL